MHSLIKASLTLTSRAWSYTYWAHSTPTAQWSNSTQVGCTGHGGGGRSFAVQQGERLQLHPLNTTDHVAYCIKRLVTVCTGLKLVSGNITSLNYGCLPQGVGEPKVMGACHQWPKFMGACHISEIEGCDIRVRVKHNRSGQQLQYVPSIS